MFLLIFSPLEHQVPLLFDISPVEHQVIKLFSISMAFRFVWGMRRGDSKVSEMGCHLIQLVSYFCVHLLL